MKISALNNLLNWRNTYSHLVLALLGGCLLFPVSSQATATSLHQSVKAALDTSPQLRALEYGQKAARFELEQSRGRYYPSVDLLLGYGPSQYSDRATRLANATPGNEDWMLKTDATLRLTQQLYDGGETAHSVSARQAGLQTASLTLKKGAQTTIFETVQAHLTVLRQQQILALAQKDLAIHQEMHRALAALAQAGSGDVADVSLVRSRIAWAESNVTTSRSEFEKARSQYRRLVGQLPGVLTFDGIPETVPDTLAEALFLAEQKNPTLLISTSKVKESEARVNVARSHYLPRVNFELSSSYNDNIEGDDTWRQNHEAMVVLRWNLFNGGQDQSGVNTAVAKSYESRLNRTDNLAALQDTVRAAWAAYISLCDQEDIYHEAALSGKETLTAYMQQFSVSRRSLLDVLNAEREFVQAAQRALSARIDRVIAAYFILQLEGELKLDRVSTNIQGRQEFEELLQSIEFPAVREILVNPQLSTPAPPFNIVHIHGLVVQTESSRKNWSPKQKQPLVQRTFLQLRPPIIASTMDNSQI